MLGVGGEGPRGRAGGRVCVWGGGAASGGRVAQAPAAQAGASCPSLWASSLPQPPGAPCQVGVGSSFTIWLPISQDGALASVEDSEAALPYTL